MSDPRLSPPRPLFPFFRVFCARVFVAAPLVVPSAGILHLLHQHDEDTSFDHHQLTEANSNLLAGPVPASLHMYSRQRARRS